MIRSYFRKWDLMRVLRLVLGIFIIVQGIMANEWVLTGLGGLFSLMPLLNIGCSSSSGCNIRIPKSNKKTENISYDEVL